MDHEHSTGKYCPVPRQPLKPNENKSMDTRVSPGQGMKPGYTGYIPGTYRQTLSFLILYIISEMNLGSRFIFAKSYGKISYDAFNN